MTMRSATGFACAWLALLGIAAPSLSQAETPPCEELADFVARTGEDSGIGGTGRSGGNGGDDDDSGVGGTGIYGSITGFGSVCVNGLRVHHDADTAIELNGRSASRESLGIGHVVWIHAETRGTGLYARRLSGLSAAVGPLTAIDVAGRQLEIGRLSVRVPEDAVVLDEHSVRLGLGGFVLGDSLDVSGFPTHEGNLVATRIERVVGERARRYTAPALKELLREAPGLSHVSIEG